MQKNSTSYSKTITKISTLNNVDFKIKKTYSPLNIIYEIKYFYPIDNIKMDILIKDEEYSKYILSENKKILNKIIITGVVALIVCVVILELIILIILKYFTQELNKPFKKINDPFFITGQIKEERQENKNKNKSVDKGNTKSDDDKIHIDEFKELLKSVSESLKSETEFKQKINKQEEDDMKLEMEYLNKEFEKNKIFNIMVDENKINNILEESNYSNEIIKYKTNLEYVKSDSFVKKSYLFREYVKFDEFEDFENSGENSFAFDSIIFKDENTLQNPNSLFYDLFKTTFDENYVKKIKELKSKRENEKKRKIKPKNNYSFKTIEEENLKEKTNSKKKQHNNNDFDKENNSEENDLKFDFKSDNDLKNDEINIKNENENELLKLYTESNEDKNENGNENDILNEEKDNKNKENIEEEEINTSKY